MALRVLPLHNYTELLEEGASVRLMQSLHSTAAGRMVDLVSPIIPDGDPDFWRVRFRDELLQRVQSGYEWLDDAEAQQAEKIGAYSYQLPFADRRENVFSYFDDNRGVADADLMRRAIDIVASRMPTGLEPASIADVIKDMPKGTNLGWPYFSSDIKFLPDVASDAELVIEHDFDAPYDPAVLFWRGQPRGIGEISKNRTVWGYPHYLTVLELMLQRPALQAIRGMPEFAAWNDFDTIDRVVTDLLQSEGYVISNDFTTYDQLLSPLLMYAAEEIVLRMFTAESAKHIQYVFTGLRRIPLITPIGVLTGFHGMPSGSGLTNWIDGLCQWVGWIYVFLRLGLPVPLKMTFQGDDGLVLSLVKPDIDTIRDVWYNSFGMKLSTDKGMVSERTCTFLQNVYDVEYTVDGICRHIRPIMRVLNGMMSYERFHSKESGWSGYADSMRWIQQVENARWHPKFQELVRFLYDHDKYIRTRTLGDIVDRAGGITKVERLLKQPSFPYGKEPISGMASYETVRILNTFRGGKFI